MPYLNQRDNRRRCLRPRVRVERVEHDGVEVEGDPVRRRVGIDAEVLKLTFRDNWFNRSVKNNCFLFSLNSQVLPNE